MNIFYNEIITDDISLPISTDASHFYFDVSDVPLPVETFSDALGEPLGWTRGNPPERFTLPAS